MQYDTGEYANSRLAGTIVKVDGEAVCVDTVNDDMECLVEFIDSGELRTVPLNGLDLSPIKLGYVNTIGNCVYMQRIPRRDDWRQGLRDNNVTYGGLLRSGVVQILKGTYPSLDEAAKRSEEEEYRVAFSKEFCIDYVGNLRYKGRPSVGKYKDGEVVLKKNFLHLEQVLGEVLK